MVGSRWRAVLMSSLLLVCALGGVAVAAPAPAPTDAPSAIDVGKWPEGVVVSGDVAWVAESGQRQVAKLDLVKGKVISRVKVGRLPVQLGLADDGTLYVMVVTDQRLYAIDAKGKKRLVKVLPDYPEDMVVADGVAWVLLWSHNSSAGSSVARIDLETRKLTRSAELGAGAWALAVGGGKVWVARDASGLVALDPTTLAASPPVAGGPRRMHVAAGDAAVYTDDGDGVVAVDPATGAVTGRAALTEPVSVLAFLAGEVVVAGNGGTVWRLDPATLAVRGTQKIAGSGAPHGLARGGDRLVVTSFDDSAAAGTLNVLAP